MKTLNVKVGEKEYVVNIPTEVEEITKDYLIKVTNLLTIAPEYSLIGIISIEEFAIVLNPSKRDLAKPIIGISVFVKAGKTDNEFINSISAGQMVIISDSDLSYGNHVNSPYNKISMNYISQLCGKDKSIRDSAFKFNQSCCFLSFKLVPNSALHGVVSDSKDEINDDPFVVMKSISC